MKINHSLSYSTLAIAAFLSLIVSSAVFSGDALTLQQFLDQVRSGHQGVRASLEAEQGGLERSKEGILIYSPSAFLNAQHGVDKKVNPFFQYSQITNDSYSLGINQQTPIGLSGKLSYNLGYSAYDGLTPGFGPNPPKYYEGHPQIDLTQSLWRNGFGSETRAQVQAAEAGAMASHYAERFKFQSALVAAEAKYWGLALARENVSVQKSALERAQKMYDWSARRVKLQLADKSDQLQAEAALLTRKLQYQAAQDDERSASRAFNLSRGLAQDEVTESLEPISGRMIQELKVPDRVEKTAEVKAAEQQQKAAEASSRLGIEKNTPSVDIFGSLAYNSHTKDSGTGVSDSFKSDRPTYGFGVKVSAPLDFWSTSSSRSGYRREEIAADLNYQRKLLEQQSDWTNLTQRLVEAKRRLEIAEKIEDSQKNKLNHEKERLNKGRTTTYQVLLFEQDYSQAQLARIQSEAEVLNLVAQMKLFGDPS